jgi:CopG family nickel-responsive transcriptional regulator
MSQIERIGVSLEEALLAKFDKLIAKQGYQSRSEAIRDLVRRQLSDEQVGNPKTEAVAAVILVYDHHSTKVIVLRGHVGEIKKTAENIISIKGVKLGRINFVAAEHDD